MTISILPQIYEWFKFLYDFLHWFLLVAYDGPAVAVVNFLFGS